MNISAWAIRTPIPSILLFMVLTVAGFFSFASLGIDENPNIDLPVVVVTVMQVGASPEELEIQVTRKVEDAVSGLGQIRHINSVVNQGTSTTSIEFELGVDTDRAVNDVRDSVTRIRTQFPADIEEPIIQRLDVFGGAFATYIVTSPTMTVGELSWLVDNEISTALLSVKGVGQIERSGGVDREISVHLRPDRLQALGLTPDEVNFEIRRANINLPGGRGEVADTEQTIRTIGSQKTIEDLRALQIPTREGGKVTLETLGEVVDTTSEPRQRAFLNGQPVVAFSLYRSAGASIATVQEASDKKLETMVDSLPDGVMVERIRTRAFFVEESYLASVEHLILGSALAVLVIFWFLKDWRASLISAVAMPMSLIPTFAAMKIADYTLNSMTLLALALVVGILVDDAIVEIENIVRHIHMGKSPYEASLEAADEIGLAVIATTFSIIVVFVPMAFMGGIPGQFFGPFGLVVAVSVFFSLVVARLLTPMMAAYMMGIPPVHDEKSFLTVVYDRILKACLNHRWLTIFAGIGFFIFGLVLAGMIPTSLIGAVDRGEIILSGELAPGTRLKKTTTMALETSNRLLSRNEVKSVFVTIGAATGSGDQAAAGSINKATFYVGLVPRGERSLKQSELELELKKLIDDIPGVRWRYSIEGGLSGKLEVILTSREPELLNQTAEQLLKEIRDVPGIYDITSGAALQQPELQVHPDTSRASELGISSQAIARTALVGTLGDTDANLAKFNLPDRQIAIRVLLDPKYRGNLKEIERLQVKTADGDLVPLGSVARVEVGQGASEIKRIDRRRQVKVEASLEPDTTLGEALEAVHKLPVMQNLPKGVAEQPAGDAEIQEDVFRGFALSMGSAVLLIYVVLVLLFQDFFQPLTIMVSLPMAIGGAILGLLVSNQPLGMYALIGIVMLMGLVTKNAILLVEHCIQVRGTGISRFDALVDAGETRLRPILMTTIAMIAGMLPIAMGIGAGAEVRAPMAIAVIGGLISSTFLTLLVVPAVYTVIDDIEHFLLSRGRKPEVS